MPKDKNKINVKDRLDENVLDLSLSGKLTRQTAVQKMFYIKTFNWNIFAEIENIPVKEIAELRRATAIDLSSNNIKFLPVRLKF